MGTKSVVVVLALVLGLAGPAVHTARADIDAEKVRDSIKSGVQYLKNSQNKDGSWTDFAPFPGGVTSLCTLALLTAGEPADDPQIQKALNYLRKLTLSQTYTVSLQTMALCAGEPKKDLLLIRRNVQWLEENQARGKKGAWGYSENHGGGDNSNSQFALLALHEAERAGVKVEERTWRLILTYWQRIQNDDGSWGYTERGRGEESGSMTCAGIAALVIASDKLNSGDAEVTDDRIVCCGNQEQNDGIDRGLAWLAAHFSVTTNAGTSSPQWLLYYLYALERVGRLTNHRFIGDHDWYREGADFLVRSQDKITGFWRGPGHAENDPHIATSLALLFLSKGRRPVLIAKLKHLPLDDWDHHRTDLHNLTGFIEKRWEKELTWQIIDLRKASSQDLLEAPVLFLSGEDALEVTDQEVKNLREYIDRGGFLFAESCCRAEPFQSAFQKLMQRVFPEPEHQLHLLPPEHPVWSAEQPIQDPKLIPPLYGVDVGCRTSVIYCPENLGCLWELARVGREDRYGPSVQERIDAARLMGANVLAYATNREVKYKLDMPKVEITEDKRSEFDRAKLYVAKLKHTGGWNVAPAALSNLMKTLSRENGLRVSLDQPQLALGDPRLFDYHLAFMHGRNSFQFSPAERKQLRTYIDRGGVVFADAVCSSDAFVHAFRSEMKLIFPDHKLRPIPVSHPMFSKDYGGFDLKKVTRREPRQRAAGGMQAASIEVEPELEGVKIGETYGVIFSPYDLSCALERHESLECAGYTREFAAKIGINIVLYSLHE